MHWVGGMPTAWPACSQAHLLSRPQPPRPVHSLPGSVPNRRGLHSPSFAPVNAFAHASHVPLHGLSQQTPSTQLLLLQDAFSVQGSPSHRRGHDPPQSVPLSSPSSSPSSHRHAVSHPLPCPALPAVPVAGE